MEWLTRNKPTRHPQSCLYCSQDMEKGEQQTVKKEWNQFGHIDQTYFHPKCAMAFYVGNEKFMHHFEITYGKLDVESFLRVFNQRLFYTYSAYYITSPFEILATFHLTDKQNKTLLEETFMSIVFDRVMKPCL